jgi:hypothetical protein
MSIDTLYHLLYFAFGAGGAYALLKQNRKDVDGVGRKVNNEISKSSVRHQNITIALMLMASDEQKDKIADLMKETHEEPDL